MENSKQNLLNCIRAFIRQRAGLEFGNYGDVSAYRSEQRSITKDRHHAEALIASVAWRDSITAEDIISASQRAYSGRLTIERTADASFKIDYCVGQYFPTEYRAAVCAVLSSVLWSYWRESEKQHAGATVPATNCVYQIAQSELGRSVASRWFN